MPNTVHIIILENGKSKIEMDALKAKKALHILRAFNHPLRQEIIKLIDENKRMKVTDIFNHFKIEQAVASQHLAVLRKAGFVTTKKESKFVYYALSYEFINHFSNTMQALFSEY